MYTVVVLPAVFVGLDVARTVLIVNVVDVGVVATIHAPLALDAPPVPTM